MPFMYYKKTNNIIVNAIWLLLLLGYFTNAYADNFDDAVNLYLDGFEQCKEASAMLAADKIPQARARLNKYLETLERAKTIDSTIVLTSKRGMNGNLSFCQRVQQSLEVEEAMPTLNDAIEFCEKSQESLNAGDLVMAQTHYDEFKKYSDHAFQIAPSMADIFSISSQVRRCERIPGKIVRFSKKQEVEALAIESLREESVAYVELCADASKTLQSRAVDDYLLKQVEKISAKAKQNQAGSKQAIERIKSFASDPGNPARLEIENNIRKGDRCIAQLSKDVKLKERQLSDLKSAFSNFLVGANNLANTCKSITASPNGAASLDKIKESQRELKSKIENDKSFIVYKNWKSVKDIKVSLDRIEQCISSTDSALAVAAKAEVSTVIKKPVPVQILKKSAIPFSTITGNIIFSENTPKLALLYIESEESSSPELQIEFSIYGFSKELYVVGKESKIVLKNTGNFIHRFTIVDDYRGFSEALDRLHPQRRTSLSVSWPENTIVSIQGNKGVADSAYIANIPATSYLKLEFNEVEKSYPFKYSAVKPGNRAFLVIPGFDTVEMTFTEDQKTKLPILKNSAIFGEIEVSVF